MHDKVVAVLSRRQVYLIIPQFGVQRVSNGKPVPMDLEIRRPAGIIG